MGKGRAITRSKKIMKGKKYTGKRKHIAKVVEQLLKRQYYS